MQQSPINELWDVLEETQTEGHFKRLYGANLPIEVYATFQTPERYYGVAFSFSEDIHINVRPFENLERLNIGIAEDGPMNSRQLLVVQILNEENRGIFASLCEDLIRTISELDDERKIANAVINQLERWKMLFDRSCCELLSAEAQKGLFGELHFLQKVLAANAEKPLEAVETWTGIADEIRDFRAEHWEVEVKTSSTGNPQKVKINGERQLDETSAEKLYLYHLSVEVSKSSTGQTLGEKVAEVRTMLADSLPALNLLESKLFEASFRNSDESKYDSRYTVRSERSYAVKGEFPRIRESDLRKGVCSVGYSIVLDECGEYEIPLDELSKVLAL